MADRPQTAEEYGRAPARRPKGHREMGGPVDRTGIRGSHPGMNTCYEWEAAELDPTPMTL